MTPHTTVAHVGAVFYHQRMGMIVVQVNAIVVVAQAPAEGGAHETTAATGGRVAAGAPGAAVALAGRGGVTCATVMIPSASNTMTLLNPLAFIVS